MRESLADRMKALEMAEAGRMMMPGLPVLARLDGRAFHTYCRGMEKPADHRMMTLMQATTAALVEEFHPALGYTQSDEITLVWLEPVAFGGRYQKVTSVLAGFASAFFAQEAAKVWPDKARIVPCFDCRVWQVPDMETVLDVLTWREDDATRNSLTALAQAHYSHKQLHEKGWQEKHDMLHAKGVNWNDCAPSFKRGTYMKRVTRERMLTPEELERIPEKFRPTGPVARSAVELLSLPPIRKWREQWETVFPPKEGTEP